MHVILKHHMLAPVPHYTDCGNTKTPWASAVCMLLAYKHLGIRIIIYRKTGTQKLKTVRIRFTQRQYHNMTSWQCKNSEKLLLEIMLYARRGVGPRGGARGGGGGAQNGKTCQGDE